MDLSSLSDILMRPDIHTQACQARQPKEMLYSPFLPLLAWKLLRTICGLMYWYHSDAASKAAGMAQIPTGDGDVPTEFPTQLVKGEGQ